MPQSDGNATPVTQSQVLMYFCEYFLSDVRGIGGTEPVILFRGFFFSFFSPGRSPSCYDHEIIMMNHVYKERFPKVRTHKTLQFCLTTNYLHYQTCSVASFCRPQLRWRKGFRRSSAATLLRPSSPWQMACLALPITR